MTIKVVSGGQTGVDRAGLDAALAAGLPTGGYCPKGRLAEDGTIPQKYQLTETKSPRSHLRTERNVVESDATLILNRGRLSQGTRLTYDLTVKHGRPSLVVQLDAEKPISPKEVAGWIGDLEVRVLNVAGPRESKYPQGIYAEALRYLEEVFSLLPPDPP